MLHETVSSTNAFLRSCDICGTGTARIEYTGGNLGNIYGYNIIRAGYRCRFYTQHVFAHTTVVVSSIESGPWQCLGITSILSFTKNLTSP